jgi:deoxyadenosine/deoxycytidine kinase
MTESAHSYVAIEGAIGVGKTTLARILREPLRAELLLEVFEENPFLGGFYADPERYAFQTQIFFLLSRHRQQRHVIHRTLRGHSLVSDYMFDKDRLFAQLTLGGDELTMYDRVHAILGEQIPTPDLVVFLRASTDELMRRISFRDRAYERAMSRDYIDQLRLAYEHFFARYTSAPVLAIDTSDLDFVRDSEARRHVVGRVRETLDSGLYQQPLLELDPPARAGETPHLPTRRGIGDIQRWQRSLDGHDTMLADPYFNYIALMGGIGHLGAELAAAWRTQEQIYEKVGNRQEARETALAGHMPVLQEQLGDCLASLLRLANLAGVDLETGYLARFAQDDVQT